MRKMVLTLAALLVFGAVAVATAAPRPQASASSAQASSTVSGSLTFEGAKLLLKDQATNKTFEVRGEGLEKYVGQRITVTGQLTPGTAGALDIITVSQVSRAAAAATGGKAAAAGVKAGLSKAVVVGVAGGATAATVGTLYAADVIGGDEEAVSRK